MELWARSFPDVQFLCVCVDHQGVAIQFAEMFQFKQVVNCYIPSRRYLPVGYGQLGCSGFIVVNKEGTCFLSRKTRAYLQYGEDAFPHVEEILSKELDWSRKDDDQTKKNDVSDGEVDNGKKAQEISEGEEKKCAEALELASVGVDCMDDEHERCADALNSMMKTLDVKELEQVFQELSQHFHHEEVLMKKYKFGNNDGIGAFSPLQSHMKDHQRILAVVQNEMERISRSELTNTMSECQVA